MIDAAERVATVDGRALSLAEVEATVAGLRAGRLGAVLPSSGTAEGRNLRRWVVQLCAAERIVRRDCAERGLPAGTELGLPVGSERGLPAGTELGLSAGDRGLPAGGPRPDRLTVEAALQVGGVASAVLHRVPAALDLVPPEPVPEAEVRGYFDRNPELFTAPYERVRDTIAAELAAYRRVARFGHWLDRAMRDRVQLETGFEHPAEPGHPDSTHRH